MVAGYLINRTPDEKAKRIAPDRRWFGNTRVVGQKQLEDFREEMSTHVNDPYTVVMRTKQLPMGLLSDPFQHSKMNLLTAESFKETFGSKSQRKKPKLPESLTTLDGLVARATNKAKNYHEDKDSSGGKLVIKSGDKEIKATQNMFEKVRICVRHCFLKYICISKSASMLVSSFFFAFT